MSVTVWSIPDELVALSAELQKLGGGDASIAALSSVCRVVGALEPEANAIQIDGNLVSVYAGVAATKYQWASVGEGEGGREQSQLVM
jgi:hypothetical protein